VKKVFSARAAAILALLIAACTNQTSLPNTPAKPAGRPAPALVQVENDPMSHPQYGLQKADMVYEYLTEGSITRFTLVFMNPQGGDRVEPVRSARLVTLRVVKAYQGVLFYSGASDHVLGMINDGHVPNFNESSGYFARDSSRPAPHNLYTTLDQLKQGVAKSGQTVTYEVPKNGEPTGQGDAAMKFSFQQTPSHSVSYSYSAGDQTYSYSYEGGALTDAGASKPVAITNVVLVRVAHHGAGYTEDVAGAEGIDFDLQGSGPADVYSRGKHFGATWDLNQGPLRLLDKSGKPLALPSGLTWIHLVDPDMQVQAG
jgi:hypothetical protein